MKFVVNGRVKFAHITFRQDTPQGETAVLLDDGQSLVTEDSTPVIFENYVADQPTDGQSDTPSS